MPFRHLIGWPKKNCQTRSLSACLHDLTERLGQVDIKFCHYLSGGAVREMFLLLCQIVKAGVVVKVKPTNTFGLLTDEECDIMNLAQLLTFIKFVDVN